MTQLYPLLMSPAFDPRPWGTLDLSADLSESQIQRDASERPGSPATTAWSQTARWRNDRSADLSKEFGAELVGTAARDPQRFPLLLKFLFPEEKLSVQVHPDDATAQRFGEPWGKTECWYVAHAQAGIADCARA